MKKSKIVLILLLSFCMMILLTSCEYKQYFKDTYGMTDADFEMGPEPITRPFFNEYVSVPSTLIVDTSYSKQVYDPGYNVIGAKVVFDSLDEPEEGCHSFVDYHHLKLILDLDNGEQLELNSVGEGSLYYPPSSFSYDFYEHIIEDSTVITPDLCISCSLKYQSYNTPKEYYNSISKMPDYPGLDYDYVYFNQDLSLFTEFTQLVKIDICYRYWPDNSGIRYKLKMLPSGINYEPVTRFNSGTYKLLDGVNNYYINQKDLNLPNQDVLVNYDNIEFILTSYDGYQEEWKTGLDGLWVTHDLDDTYYTLSVLVSNSETGASEYLDCHRGSGRPIASKYDFVKVPDFPTRFICANCLPEGYEYQVAIYLYAITADLMLNGKIVENQPGFIVRLVHIINNDGDYIEQFMFGYLDN